MKKFSIYCTWAACATPTILKVKQQSALQGTTVHERKCLLSCFIWEDLDLPDHWISSIIPIILQWNRFRHLLRYNRWWDATKSTRLWDSAWSRRIRQWPPGHGHFPWYTGAPLYLTCQHWQYTDGWSWLCTHNTITMNTLGLRHEPAWLLHQHEPAILLITSLKGRWPMWFFIYLEQYPDPPKDDIGSCKSCSLCNYEPILFNISHLPGGWLVPKKNIRTMGMINGLLGGTLVQPHETRDTGRQHCSHFRAALRSTLRSALPWLWSCHYRTTGPLN